MERELSIAELAQLWGVSVPTTWNRIKKEGLTTFKKKDKNNKEINYVSISEEILKDYVINDNNNLNNAVNNGHYEELLTDNNVNNPQNTVITTNPSESLTDIINTITTINNDYNNRLQSLTDELITYKSKSLLLEDKAGREGYYLNEINELKKENNRNKLYNKLLITVITILLLFITGFITYNVAKSDKVSDTVEPKSDIVQEEVKPAPIVQPAPKPASVKKVVKKR